MPKVALNPGSNTKTAIATAAEVDRLLIAARDLSLEHWAVVTVLVRTGMHISVLTRLTPDNLQAGVLRWERTKKTPYYGCRGCRRRLPKAEAGGKPATCLRCGSADIFLTIPAKRVCALRVDRPDLREALGVFFMERTKSVDHYDDLVKEAAAAAGMPEISSLSLRKTRALELRKAGLTAEEVAIAIGCTVDLVEEVYTLQKMSDLVDRVGLADRLGVQGL